MSLTEHHPSILSAPPLDQLHDLADNLLKQLNVSPPASSQSSPISRSTGRSHGHCRSHGRSEGERATVAEVPHETVCWVAAAVIVPLWQAVALSGEVFRQSRLAPASPRSCVGCVFVLLLFVAQFPAFVRGAL